MIQFLIYIMTPQLFDTAPVQGMTRTPQNAKRCRKFEAIYNASSCSCKRNLLLGCLFGLAAGREKFVDIIVIYLGRLLLALAAQRVLDVL